MLDYTRGGVGLLHIKTTEEGQTNEHGKSNGLTR
jgi:hypothetical protein